MATVITFALLTEQDLLRSHLILLFSWELCPSNISLRVNACLMRAFKMTHTLGPKEKQAFSDFYPIKFVTLTEIS